MEIHWLVFVRCKRRVIRRWRLHSIFCETWGSEDGE